jgi:flavin reductase (DIM6/NTAB) family NADH-FMN oxidoreductase RutF
MSSLGSRSMGVFFICPRPVVLVSVVDGNAGNVFPMNLMGSIGNGCFAFALNSSRPASSLVERSGRVALSSIPLEQASVARQLGRNHRQESVDWNQLPFPVKMSTALGIPVPGFALRVREMQIEAARKLGSHTLFMAQIIRDETWAEGLQFFMVHGVYQAWRLAEPETATKSKHS